MPPSQVCPGSPTAWNPPPLHHHPHPPVLHRQGLKPITLYFVIRYLGGLTFGLHIMVMDILVSTSRLDDKRFEGHTRICPPASVTHHPLSVPETCRNSVSVHLLSFTCPPCSERTLSGPPAASSQRLTGTLDSPTLTHPPETAALCNETRGRWNVLPLTETPGLAWDSSVSSAACLEGDWLQMQSNCQGLSFCLKHLVLSALAMQSSR